MEVFLTENEYIDICYKQCSKCPEMRFSTSRVSGRRMIGCQKAEPQYPYPFQCDFYGLEEFFLNPERWRNCEHFTDRSVLLFNVEKEHVFPVERKIMIRK